MAERAFITPKVLQWARKSARMTLEIAAKKVGKTPEIIDEWENGNSQPTIRQAESLAKAYRRPFALLFLPDIPHDFQPLQDFRRKTAIALGTASIFIIREIRQKQAWISEIFEEYGEEQLSFVGKFSIQTKPVTVAHDILETLQIVPTNYSSDNPIKEWIDKAESKGIFISRTSFIHSRLTLDKKEIQGFSIADKFAPFVFVNSDDWKAPQLFTLVHEIAHIWINESGISNEIEAKIKDRDKIHPVELFCNEVAANALMPIDIMNNLVINVFDNSYSVFKVAKKIGISSFALLVRAFKLKLISLDSFINLKKEAESDFKDFLKREKVKKARLKEKKGGPNPYLLRLNKNSHLFTQIVLDAYRGGRIEPTQASFLLNTQINKFHRFEDYLY